MLELLMMFVAGHRKGVRAAGGCISTLGIALSAVGMRADVVLSVIAGTFARHGLGQDLSVLELPWFVPETESGFLLSTLFVAVGIVLMALPKLLPKD